MALAGTRRLRSQGQRPVHAYRTRGVTGSERREGANGVGNGIGVGGRNGDGNGVGAGNEEVNSDKDGDRAETETETGVETNEGPQMGTRT